MAAWADTCCDSEDEVGERRSPGRDSMSSSDGALGGGSDSHEVAQESSDIEAAER